MQLYLQRFRIVLLFLYAVRVGASEGGQGGTYKVEVVRTDQTYFSVYVEPSETVASFKQVIREALGDAGRGVSIILVFGFKTLQNCNDKKSKAAYTLEDYNIQHGSQVRLFTRKKRNKDHTNKCSKPKGPVIKEAYKTLLCKIVKEAKLELLEDMYTVYPLLYRSLANCIFDIFNQEGYGIAVLVEKGKSDRRIEHLKLIYKDDEKVVDYFCELFIYCNDMQPENLAARTLLLATVNTRYGIRIVCKENTFLSGCQVLNTSQFDESFMAYQRLAKQIDDKMLGKKTCLVEGMS